MNIPKGYKIAFELPLPESEVDFFNSLKEVWESAEDQIEELTHRRDEAVSILKGSVLRRYWEMEREHIKGAQILFDPQRKAIIEVTVDDNDSEEAA